MARNSHVYLHLESVGGADRCIALREELRPVFKAMYARGEIRGYRLFVLKDREEAEDELLHYMFDYESATGKQFPFMYLSLTPLDSDDSERAIDDVATAQGFQRFR